MRRSDSGHGSPALGPLGPSPGSEGWRDEPNRWDAQSVHLTRIDVPFLELTWFFIKCSLALALAFSVTSWLWVMIATGIGSLFAGLLYLVGVPILLDGAPSAAIAPADAAPPVEATAPPLPADPPPAEVLPAEAPPEAAPEAAPLEPAPTAPARTPARPADPDASATEALIREELERARRERR